MLTFRVFISSPGDASIERRRTENVISRLNGEAAGLARFIPVLWETEHYKAHETFQTQIPPATDCDIVVGILRWRLGTELPPTFATLPTGEPYPSGTAYELLTAIEKRRSGAELPDVFVFRYSGGAPNPPLDDPRRDTIERGWNLLLSFFERWFVSKQGHFLAALNTYGSEDDFEVQLETMLRKWTAAKVAGGRLLSWPAIKGSPFRGLSVFGARHAPVFFGRGADIRRATDLLRDHATRGQRYLLLVGASGAGKSSLARAGLIPRLTTPGVVPEVDIWRVAVMRPGDSADGTFAALAAALLQQEKDLPPEEEGRGPALPEIAEGDSKTPAELAAVLAHADASATRPLLHALARIGEQAQKQDRHERPVRCDLVLLVDQLDELLAPSVPAERRERFATLLAALVASGRVWVLATLRADLYAAMLAVPGLKALKDVGASYDLAPPGAAELAEIVREPAKAAGLVYEADTASGERLDERLLREADRPDMLPLVQLALARLYEARENHGAEIVLPYAAFERLGGVKGIVGEAGEGALATLGAAEQAQLAPLIRKLAEQAHSREGAGGTLTIRAVPLAEAAPNTSVRALVEALVAARLLTLSDAGDNTVVRLAHQRVLSDWDRVATIVAESGAFYRVRDEVEDQRRRWEAGNRRGELLLARGLPLAEARTLAMSHGRELGSEILAYVAASSRRANRAQVGGWVAAILFAMVAIGAVSFGLDAKAQKEIAEKAKTEAQHQRQNADRETMNAKTQRDVAEKAEADAKRQKEDASFSRDAAAGAKDGEDRVRERALTAANEFINDLSSNLESSPLSKAKSVDVLKMALRVHDALSEGNATYQRGRAETAVALFNAASFLDVKDDHKTGCDVISRSIKIWDDLEFQNDDASKNLDIQLAYGRSLKIGGRICFNAKEFSKALEFADKSVTILRLVSRQDGDANREYAYALFGKAFVHLAGHDFEAVAESMSEGVKVLCQIKTLRSSPEAVKDIENMGRIIRKVVESNISLKNKVIISCN